MGKGGSQVEGGPALSITLTWIPRWTDTNQDPLETLEESLAHIQRKKLGT